MVRSVKANIYFDIKSRDQPAWAVQKVSPSVNRIKFSAGTQFEIWVHDCIKGNRIVPWDPSELRNVIPNPSPRVSLQTTKLEARLSLVSKSGEITKVYSHSCLIFWGIHNGLCPESWYWETWDSGFSYISDIQISSKIYSVLLIIDYCQQWS